MKRSQRLAAVAGLLASAGVMAQSAPAPSSSVELYGLVGLYAGSIKRSGEAQSVKALNGGGLTTSYFGLRGREDLGGGLKAVFSLEAFFRPDTGEQGRNGTDPLFSRNAWVGLEGSLGRVAFGRQTNPTYGVMSQLSPFGSSVVFSPMVVQSFVAAYGSNIVGDTVWNNAVQLSTPTMAGVRASAIYGAGEVAGRSVANVGVHGTYSHGPFFAAVSGQRVRVNGSTVLGTGQNAGLVGATYDFGPVKVFGNVLRTSIDNGATTRLLDAGLSVPVGRMGTVMAETAQSRIESTGVALLRRTTTSVGYDHRLSKRTDVYVALSRDKRSNATSANSQAIGIRHSF